MKKLLLSLTFAAMSWQCGSSSKIHGAARLATGGREDIKQVTAGATTGRTHSTIVSRRTVSIWGKYGATTPGSDDLILPGSRGGLPGFSALAILSSTQSP